MFLTESEVNTVLQQSIFTLPVTESVVDYLFYRGTKKTSLLTVRFDLTPTFSHSFMLAYLQNGLTSAPYCLQSHLVASIHYDLLPCNTDKSPKTY